MLGLNIGLAWLIILLGLFAVPLVFFFARLSYHYGRMFDISPDMALEYQRKFSKSEVVLGQPAPRPEIAYQPLSQVRFLAGARAKYQSQTDLVQVISAAIWDLRLTMACLALEGAVVLAIVHYIFS